jgi:hypothetical protein
VHGVPYYVSISQPANSPKRKKSSGCGVLAKNQNVLSKAKAIRHG